MIDLSCLQTHLSKWQDTEIYRLCKWELVKCFSNYLSINCNGAFWHLGTAHTHSLLLCGFITKVFGFSTHKPSFKLLHHLPSGLYYSEIVDEGQLWKHHTVWNAEKARWPSLLAFQPLWWPRAPAEAHWEGRCLAEVLWIGEWQILRLFNIYSQRVKGSSDHWLHWLRLQSRCTRMFLRPKCD